MGTVKFYRGVAAKYSATTHADGVYFSTDTEEIIVNGKRYGLSKVSKDKLFGADGQVKFQDKLTAGNGIAIAADGTISTTLDVQLAKVVSSLPAAPAAGDENKIHVVANSSGAGQNVFTEYIWIDGKWEKLGEYAADVDLSEYMKASDIRQLVSSSVAAVETKLNDYASQSDFESLQYLVNALDDEAVKKSVYETESQNMVSNIAQNSKSISDLKGQLNWIEVE